MKLPVNIKVAIEQAAEFNHKATIYTNVVRDWVEENVSDPSATDVIIDCIETGNNPNALIGYLKGL